MLSGLCPTRELLVLSLWANVVGVGAVAAAAAPPAAAFVVFDFITQLH